MFAPCRRISFLTITYFQDQEKLPSALQFLPQTKKREPDSVLRLTHIETLLLLCTTRWGRDFLRANGVYEIIRAAHLEETVDKVRHDPLYSETILLRLWCVVKVSEHIERLVQLVKGAEGSGTSDDRIGSTTTSVEMHEDFDDEDNKIEEI